MHPSRGARGRLDAAPEASRSPNGDGSRFRSFSQAKASRPGGRFSARMPGNIGPVKLTELGVIGRRGGSWAGDRRGRRPSALASSHGDVDGDADRDNRCQPAEALDPQPESLRHLLALSLQDPGDRLVQRFLADIWLRRLRQEPRAFLRQAVSGASRQAASECPPLRRLSIASDI